MLSCLLLLIFKAWLWKAWQYFPADGFSVLLSEAAPSPVLSVFIPNCWGLWPRICLFLRLVVGMSLSRWSLKDGGKPLFSSTFYIYFKIYISNLDGVSETYQLASECKKNEFSYYKIQKLSEQFKKHTHTNC